tara:strand:- start:143 stop:322 length:180 start_codon:yes stop_codon:yes gene_type:complete
MSTIHITNYAGYHDNSPKAQIMLEGDEIVALRDLLERTSRHMDMGDLDDLTNQILGLNI